MLKLNIGGTFVFPFYDNLCPCLARYYLVTYIQSLELASWNLQNKLAPIKMYIHCSTTSPPIPDQSCFKLHPHHYCCSVQTSKAIKYFYH